MGTDEMYELISVSSLNLRTIRRGESRDLDEPIVFKCSVCGGKKKLGGTTPVMVRISYKFNGSGISELRVCGMCADLLTDVMRSGPRVIREAHKWKVESRVARMSIVDETLVCLNCWKQGKSHMFIKYDDLLIDGMSSSYKTRRECAKCVISYLTMLRECEGVGKRQISEMQVEMNEPKKMV